MLKLKNIKLSATAVTAAVLAWVFALSVFAASGLLLFMKFERHTVHARSDVYTVGIAADPIPTSRGVNVSSVEAGGSITVYVYNIATGNTDSGLFDIIIMPSDAENVDSLTASAGTRWRYGLTQGGNYRNYSKEPTGAAVYSGITCTAGNSTSVTITNSGASAAANINIAVVRHTDYNYFVGSSFELKMSSAEYYHNFSSENMAKAGSVPSETAIVSTDGRVHPFISDDEYANVYVVSPFTVDEDYTYNAPAYFDLLYSNITLNGNFTVKHGYSGLFSISTLTGGFIASAAKTLALDTPVAYYQTTESEIFIKANVALERTNTAELDLSAVDSSILDAIKSDSLVYIQSYLQSHTYKGIPVTSSVSGDALTITDGASAYYLASDIELPATYYNYGIAYVYSAGNSALDSAGHVTRAAANTASALTVTASYEGTAITGTENYANPYTHNVVVIGTNSDDVEDAYIAVLGELVSHTTLASGLTEADGEISYGTDILEFTKKFGLDTGFLGTAGNSAALSLLNNALEFEIVAASKTVGEETVALTASEFTNSITLTAYEDGTGEIAFAVAGYNDVSYLIVRPPYFTADETDRIILTCGETSLYSAEIDISGCPVQNRNEYINSIATQIYIGESHQAIDVLNIRDDGTYIGSSLKKYPTRISVKETGDEYIAYSMYFLNQAATDAVAGIDAYIALNPAVTRYALLESILTNTPTSDSADYINSNADYGGALAQITYNGRGLLGLPANTYFTYDNGVLTMNNNSFSISGGTIVLVGRIEYTDNEKYHILRTLYSPASGLGGTETQYSNSNIFDEQFGFTGNWLTLSEVDLVPQNPVIRTNSIVYTVTTESGTTYTGDLNFGAGVTYPTYGATPSATYSAPACDYFEIDWENNKFVIKINAENVPVENSTVNVTAKVSDGSTEMVLDYSFIIPGIYKYNRDIADIWIYLRMLQVYGNHDGFLFVDDVREYNGEFDSSSETINTSVSVDGTDIDINYLVACGIIGAAPTAPANTYVFDITGIQYAVNTVGMTFDGLKVDSLEPFARFDSNAMLYLCMTGCSITDVMLKGTAAFPYPLYNLNLLETVVLADNSIDTLDKTNAADTASALYRTVTSLNLDSCGLDSLEGIENLVNLQMLYVRGNSVKNFFPLTTLPALTDAYIGNNGVSGDDYGTHGNINLCNIVALMHKNVNVYVRNGSADILTKIYEKTGTAYYYKGEIAAIDNTNNAFSDIENENNITRPGGYLITAEQEYLATLVNAYFNFKTVKVSTIAAADTEAFPAYIPESVSNGVTHKYSVTVVDATDENPADSATKRTYIIRVTYAGTGTYRFNNVYKGVNNNAAQATVSREITFNVTTS